MKKLQQKQHDHEIVCHRCKHYFITWDPKHPYGCKAFGMKSKQQPSQVVRSSSSQSCLMYQPKEK